ncbi:hypothetical protein M0R89_13300 [Halorussus limi]|uniref:Right-handed parallel beta-helix repeat-containing protein n=1 Tax=Halorussus limi TaxID=2938695 RepID=A0A8U0HS61_9EURY|nr:hypothetical protein [Halorussus limi]UPV73514.1 hypothetical protein M0R89_13300 [Halorussus limi]
MARDKTARERGERAVDRRSFLGAAGAGIAGAFGASALATGVTDAAEYRTVTVSAGETRTFSVGSGQTFENVLIDMTADGASAKIYANGDGWTVRNVAFKGNHPGGHYLFTPAVSKGGTATVENLYMGDGQTEGSGKGGIWVNGRDHYGTLNFRNVNIQHFIDNGLYGTDPGYSYHGSHGGVVNVYDSYFNSNNIANIRVGSIDGRTCYVENCVVKGGSTRGCGVGCSAPGAKNPRGVWAWWGPVEVKDSDIGSSPARVEQDSRAGDPTIISKNTRWGSDADTSRVPSGVPMTAEEAASGTSSASGGSDGPSTTDPTQSDAEGALLELVAGSNTSSISYEFTAEGSVTKRTGAGDVKSEANDSVTDNGDGTVTVSGVAGNGYGDSYLVDGDVVSMDLDESKWTLRWEGDEVTVSDLVLPNKLVIDGGNRPNRASDYTFEVSGAARKSAALGSVNDHDTISNGTISGRVIGGTDGYRFSGEITAFSLDGPANVRVEDGS